MAHTHLICVASLLAVLGTACGASPAAPTPTPTPVPPNPSATCCSLSGIVTETAPTALQGVAGASVTVIAGLDAGMSTIADAAGQYLLSKLQLGAITLRSSANGYDDTFLTLTITGDRSGFGFQLNPTNVMVSARHADVVSDQDAVCQNFEVSTRLPCKTYLIALHSAGVVTAVLNWDDAIEVSSALALELVREPGTNQGDRIELNHVTQGNPNREEVIATLAPGLYSVRVLYQRPLGPQAFILTMSHPR
jgi:hypothetical protein